MPNRMPLVLRLLAAFAVLGNVVFNYTYGILGTGPTMRTVSERHETLFTPANYAFSIWGLIYTALIAFVFSTFLPSNRRSRAVERTLPGLIATQVLSTLWIIVFLREAIVESACVIVLNLAAAIVFYVESHAAVARGRQSHWFSAPASLLLGWLSVASMANIAMALQFTGYDGSPLTPALWTVILIGVAVALSLTLGVRYRDFVVPAVVSWSTAAIAVEAQDKSDLVALVATGAAILTGFAALGLVLHRYRLAQPPRLNRPRGATRSPLSVGAAGARRVHSSP